MKGIVTSVLLAASLSLAWGQVQAERSCSDHIRIVRSTANVITADALKSTRTLDPSFFGFNLEWLEFQLGLWDPSAHRVLPEVTRIFKAFPGAVYRFPGGTNANHISWRDATGPTGSRPEKPYVSWMPPLRAEFGLEEYLRFVNDVGGQAWYVANLYGSPTGPRSAPELATEARALSQHVAQRSRYGSPRILRWELGNELDRGAHKWSPAKLAQTANLVAQAIRQGDASAQFVHLQQEYPAQQANGYTADRYNRELRAGLAALKPDLALHFYYDGKPDTPSVNFFLRALCQVVDSAKSEGGSGKVWITEHARVPNGFWVGTPKAMWPETANLLAAISLADMLIALAPIPEVSGAFTHSLVASGSPWPLLHKRADQTLDPSATLLGMMVLRQTMKPQVLEATQFGGGRGWQGATYAVRSAVLSTTDRGAYTLWSINRSDEAQTLLLQIKNAPKELTITGAFRIADQNSITGNHSQADRLQIERTLPAAKQSGPNRWLIELAPNSVNALLFH